jgi:hypothetical protein
LALARIAAPWPQPYITADITTFLESIFVLNGEHESQSDQRSNSADLLEECGLRVILPGDLLDFAITIFDSPAWWSLRDNEGPFILIFGFPAAFMCFGLGYVVRVLAGFPLPGDSRG